MGLRLEGKERDKERRGEEGKIYKYINKEERKKVKNWKREIMKVKERERRRKNVLLGNVIISVFPK